MSNAITWFKFPRVSLEFDENGFVDNGNGLNIPGEIIQPGYSEEWKRAVATDNGEVLRVVE